MKSSFTPGSWASRVKVTDRGGQTGKSPAAASQPGVKRRADYRLAAETGVNAREKVAGRAWPPYWLNSRPPPTWTGKSAAAAFQPGVKRRADYRLAAETGVNAREKVAGRAWKEQNQ